MQNESWTEFLSSSSKRGEYFTYIYPRDRSQEDNSLEGQLGKQDFIDGDISSKILSMRAAPRRPPILVWDERLWTGRISSEMDIQHQIESKHHYYCRICFSKKKFISDLREHCYNLHTWMMGENADVNTRFVELPEAAAAIEEEN